MNDFRTTVACWLAGVCLGIGCAAGPASAAAAGFTLQDQPGQHLDVLLDGRLVARYMYAYDTSTPERATETNKPYLHIFDAEGKAPITNGPAGVYPHHRGIFIGWTKIECAGKVYNSWGIREGAMVQRQLLAREAGPQEARLTALIHWNDPDGQPYVEETRTMILRRGPAPLRLLVDFTATLKAVRADLTLGGNADHGGVQYRPANELDLDKTVYVFPKADADPRADRDYPWVGESYTLSGQRYSVVDLNHPQNHKETLFSAYRDYGRFGAFFETQLAKDETLTVKYRFLIGEGEMPDAAVIQAAWNDYAGQPGTPVPQTTVRAAEAKVAKKPPAKPAK